MYRGTISWSNSCEAGIDGGPSRQEMYDFLTNLLLLDQSAATLEFTTFYGPIMIFDVLALLVTFAFLWEDTKFLHTRCTYTLLVVLTLQTINFALVTDMQRSLDEIKTPSQNYVDTFHELTLLSCANDIYLD